MVDSNTSEFLSVLEKTLRLCEAPAVGETTENSPSDIDIRGLGKDLGTMLHSLATKLSLAARPPRTPDAITKCLQDIEKLLPVFATMCQSLRPSIHGEGMCEKIKSHSRYALLGLQSLVSAVLEEPVSEARLGRTGILWESCKELQNVETLQKIVSNKISEAHQMISDAVEDLQSWASGEADDNFGDFEDSSSETDNEDHNVHAVHISSAAQADNERRISMFKRIQLLLKAINKRKICESSPLSLLNECYSSCSKLAVEVDDLAGEIQEGADEALVGELEKAVVLRVEELLVSASTDNADEKWSEWSQNFGAKWLSDVKKNHNSIQCYDIPPTYAQFLEKHLKPLNPCIISGLIDDWPCYRDWRTRLHDDSYGPNYEYLKANYGPISVSVLKKGNSSTSSMVFSDFLQDMEMGTPAYARDIHIQRLFPELVLYDTPTLFQDDWLNFQLDSTGKDDYKFVYIGSDGTQTKLHKDVVASHSWSTNLTGRKEWTLIPPLASHLLFSFDHEDVAPDIYATDSLTCARWPNLAQAREQSIVVQQSPGETIFVPSTWYHQVLNVGPTLSINHNWINAVSLRPIFDNLVHEMNLSAEAVIDLKEDGIVDEQGFTDVVQELTMANAGMNWQSFFQMILHRFKHEADYTPSDYRPPKEYEVDVVRDICHSWSALGQSKVQVEVQVLLQEIMDILIKA